MEANKSIENEIARLKQQLQSNFLDSLETQRIRKRIEELQQRLLRNAKTTSCATSSRFPDALPETRLFSRRLTYFCEQEAEMLRNIERLLLSEKTSSPVALLTGDPGIGKTVMARTLINRFKKKGWLPFYYQLNSYCRFDELWTAILESAQRQKTFMVIDNCHVSLSVAVKIYQSLQDVQNCCCLFISRSVTSHISYDMPLAQLSFFTALQEKSFELLPNFDKYAIDKISGIIRKYKVYYERMYKQPFLVGNETQIIDHVRRNFELLDIYLSSWKNIERLDQVVEEPMFKELEREIQRKNAELQQSRQMASLGMMASGLAHEINQPLQIILGRAQNCLKDIELQRISQTEIIADLQHIVKTTKRIDRIINHLHVLSRQRQPRLQLLDMNVVIENSLILLNEQLKIRGIIVEKKFHTELPHVKADMVQMEQVFINLLTNARDALEGCEEKRIIISTNIMEHTNKIGVTFEDTGIGISQADRPKIFEAFFTKKEKGTGLGLFIVQDIIKTYQGSISVESDIGKGTRFLIRIPIASEEERHGEKDSFD